MDRRTKIIIIAPIIILVLLLLPLILPDKENEGKLTTITVGYINISDCVPLQNDSIFASYGLRLDLVQTPGGAAILNSVINKQTQIAYTNLVSPILATVRGYNLKIFGVCSVENPEAPAHQIITSLSSGITNPVGLKGKTIAVNTLKNIDHLFLTNFLKKQGINPEDIKLVEVPFPQMINVLQQGDVDAIATVEPFVTNALNMQYNKIGSYFLTDSTTYTDVAAYASNGDWAADNMEVIERFILALRKSQLMLSENPTSFRNKIIEKTNLDKSIALKMTLPTFTETPTLKGLENIFELIQTNNFIDKKEAQGFDASDLLIQ